MAAIPAGRTSSVKALDKTFILQTEFKIQPKQAIVTAVALDGQVIHKVEKSYPHPIETEDDLMAAEAAIVSQHESIGKKIMVNGVDFVKQTKSIKISRADRLGIIPGVSYVADIIEKINSGNPPPVYDQAKLIMDIGDAVTRSSRMGKLRLAAIITESGKFILDHAEAEGYLITLKNETEIGKIISEIEIS